MSKPKDANEIAQRLKDGGYIKYETGSDGIVRGSLIVVNPV